MNQGAELDATSTHIFTVITASLSTLTPPPGVFDSTVPDGARYPYVVFNHQANSDSEVSEGVIVVNQSTWLVKGVDRSESYDGLKPVRVLFHAALHRAFGSVGPDGQVLFGRRISSIRFPEVTDNVEYRHLGGLYLFITQGAQ